jgi:predicted dehydrogenase
MLPRREFLVASAAAFVLPSIQALGANDTINVGLIGTGGRCRHLLKSLVKIPKVRVTGLCDVYDDNIALTKPMAEANAFVTKKHAELLAKKDIDAVLIAAPDHWHVPLTIDAVNAGKDVYVEKPLTHDASEGKAVIEAVRKSKRVVQVGTQQRSMPHIQKGKELVAEGKLGKVFKVKMSWNRNAGRVNKAFPKIDPATLDWKTFLGNAKDQPLDPYRFRQWRWFWDFGGGIFTDLMVHWIDVAHYILESEHPSEARSIGQFITAKDVWETPDTVETLMLYPKGVQMHFEGTFSNARMGARIEILGTDGTLYMDRGRYELIPEPGKGEPSSMILGDGPKGKDFYEKPDGELLHLENWIDCIRSRKATNSPVESGVLSAAAAHLANQSLRTEQVAKWKE